MGLIEFPEAKLARRIFAIHSLKIPFDLNKLVEHYANLTYKHIPIPGIDGVSINLKIPGKIPTIIVNSNIPKTRQLFTLAHELGHIIIPWHLGTIIDDIHNQSYKDFVYSQIEQEANRFAAELLMPRNWVLQHYKRIKDEALLLEYIVKTTNVSDHAATIRMMETLPSNILYAAVQDGIVLHSGMTQTTQAFPQSVGSLFSSDFYPYYDNYSTHYTNTIDYHWWKISTKIKISANDIRPWREILDEILDEIQPPEGKEPLKRTINGIIAHVHGKIKYESDYNVDSVISGCIYKLRRDNLTNFTSHRDFEKFVKIRVKDFFK